MFFTEKYALKAEIDRLNNKSDVILADLNSKNEEVTVLEENNQRLSKENIGIKGVNKKITSERNKLKKLVREQTEADLLINALKGLGIIKTSKDYDAFAIERQLSSIQNQAASMNARQGQGLMRSIF